MYITILALGSRGDVLPYTVLGAGLQRAGHRVRVATFENFAAMVTERGLDFHPVRGDAESLLRSTSGLALAESGQNVLRQVRNVHRSFGALADSYARDFSDPVLWETDAIINQLPGGLFGADLAEKLGVPMILAAVMPLTRTGAFPMMGFPAWPAPLPGYNALTYRLAEQLVWHGFRAAVNRWRQEVLGLPKQSFWGQMGRLYQEGVPVLNGFSAHVVPRPDDWPAHVHITGYWFPQEEAWQPPDDLRRFLDAGPRPVFVGFGSMPLRRPGQVTRLVLDALRQSGQRAVLHTGMSGTGRDDLPDDVFPIRYAPYGWLFSRMAALVHHGGSGTTGFGLRAGVPTVIVPFLFDQFYWGRRVQALGAGPAPVPFKELTVENLAAAIDAAANDMTMRARAAALGVRIREEAGVGEAVAVVERTL